MGNFGFGDFVEKVVHRYDENKKLIPKTVAVPRIALHIDGRFRLTCGDEIILAKADMFEPSNEEENRLDFDWDNFNWDIQGINRFDEVTGNLFNEEPQGFIVSKATISKWGDLKISFENGFILETFIDDTSGAECWRFFEVGSKQHIVVGGQGLKEDDLD